MERTGIGARTGTGDGARPGDDTCAEDDTQAGGTRAQAGTRAQLAPGAGTGADGAEGATDRADRGDSADGTTDRADSADGATDRDVAVLDDEAPVLRIRRPTDAYRLLAAVLAMALALVVGAVAEGTASGLAVDVTEVRGRIPGFVVGLADLVVGLVTSVLPWVVLGELLVRRLFRQFGEALLAGILGTAAGIASVVAIELAGTAELVQALEITTPAGTSTPPVVAYLVGVAALLTVAGPRHRSSTVGAAWWLLWGALGTTVLIGDASLLAALLTALLGRAVGLSVRYLTGASTNRAYGAALVAALRRAGIDPVGVRRCHVPAHGNGGAETTSGRAYAVRSAAGRDVDVTVLDEDRQGVGVLSRLWRAVRLRGPVDRRTLLSLRQAAQQEALVTYAVTAAGVRTPRLIAVAEAGPASMLLAREHVAGHALDELPDDEVTDELSCALWGQLARLHDAGIAHRALTAEAVYVDSDGAPWLVGLGSGEVAASDLQFRLDVAQLLAVLALRTGPERAVRTGVDVLGIDQLTAALPLVQPLALSDDTRRALRGRRGLLSAVRQTVLSLAPGADIEPEKLERFGWRTVVTWVAGTVAAYLLVSQVGRVELGRIVTDADTRWVAQAVAVSLATYIGAALSLLAFVPQRLAFWRTLWVQVASSFVNLVAPAGVGVAALNARYVQRAGVPAGIAVAAVGLTQVSGVVVTVGLLLVLGVVTGSGEEARLLPSGTTLAALAVIAAVVVLALTVPRVRAWAWRRIRPAVAQTLPRLLDVLQQPGRLALGLGGNLAILLGYLFALDACLRAYGVSVPLADLAIVFLAGSAIGSAAPTPGGLGAVEAALVAGLTTAGVDGATALSATLLYRALTFWLRVPPGWLAFNLLQRRRAV